MVSVDGGGGVLEQLVQAVTLAVAVCRQIGFQECGDPSPVDQVDKVFELEY